jgi:hypothetical protein
MRTIPGLLVLLPTLLFADEVYLQGGAKFTGRIEQQTETMVTINIGDGVVGVPVSRVERIVKGRSPLDEYEERAGRLKPEDAEGWRSLGRWALQQGLSAQSRQAYKNVMTVAPNDAEARQALGYVLHEGRWLTEEESYRARGYVKYDGEWMTSAEAQQARASEAADQARQEAERRANVAEAERIQAEARAEKAEERAKEAEERDTWGQPVYWGGWGYGMTVWPSANSLSTNPVNWP